MSFSRAAGAEFPMLKNSERTPSTSMSAWQRRSRAAISSGAVSRILVTAFYIPINCLWAQFTSSHSSLLKGREICIPRDMTHCGSTNRASAAELIDLYQRKADWFAYARSRETSQVVVSSDGLPHLPFNQPLPR